MEKSISFLKRIAGLFNNWKARRNEHAKVTQRIEYENEALEYIQAKEFCGELYISVENEPVVPVRLLNMELPVALKIARANWVRYKMNNLISEILK